MYIHFHTSGVLVLHFTSIGYWKNALIIFFRYHRALSQGTLTLIKNMEKETFFNIDNLDQENLPSQSIGPRHFYYHRALGQRLYQDRTLHEGPLHPSSENNDRATGIGPWSTRLPFGTISAASLQCR